MPPLDPQEERLLKSIRRFFWLERCNEEDPRWRESLMRESWRGEILEELDSVVPDPTGSYPEVKQVSTTLRSWYIECEDCGKEKPRDKFIKISGGRYGAQCQECRIEGFRTLSEAGQEPQVEPLPEPEPPPWSPPPEAEGEPEEEPEEDPKPKHEPDPEHKCKTCKKWLPRDQFGTTPTGNPSRVCTPCKNEYEEERNARRRKEYKEERAQKRAAFVVRESAPTNGPANDSRPTKVSAPHPDGPPPLPLAPKPPRPQGKDPDRERIDQAREKARLAERERLERQKLKEGNGHSSPPSSIKLSATERKYDTALLSRLADLHQDAIPPSDYPSAVTEIFYPGLRSFCYHCDKEQQHYLKSPDRFRCNVCSRTINPLYGTILDSVAGVSTQSWCAALDVVRETKGSAQMQVLAEVAGVSEEEARLMCKEIARVPAALLANE